MGDYGMPWPDNPYRESSYKDDEWLDAYYDARDTVSFDDEPQTIERARDNLRENADIMLYAWRELGGVDEFYRFPAMEKLDEWTNQQQIDKVLSEYREAAKAEVIYRCGEPEWRMSYGMELMDIIHATETALRIEFTDEEVERLRDEVEKKNRDRGYYGGND